MSRRKHIDDGSGKALCKIAVRSGELRENDSGRQQRMGGVDNVILVQVNYPVDLGQSNMCLKCTRKYKEKVGK